MYLGVTPPESTEMAVHYEEEQGIKVSLQLNRQRVH